MNRVTLQTIPMLFATALLLSLAAHLPASERRSPDQQDYAEQMWRYIHREGSAYRHWATGTTTALASIGPTTNGNGTIYLNRIAEQNRDVLPKGSIVVREHHDEDGEVSGISVWSRQREGYNANSDDWYWAHFLPDGTVAWTLGDRSPARKPGFATFEEDGRLWVFRCGSDELAEFLSAGELAKHVIRPKAGPKGMTLKAPDSETITAFVSAKPGFVTESEDGRLWVFREGSKELEEYRANGELAKHVIRPKAGPLGMTLKAPDSDTITLYVASRPGFVVEPEDGRLWVFREGSDELNEYREAGELAKHVIRPKAGPLGMTLKAPDAETIDDYLASGH